MHHKADQLNQSDQRSLNREAKTHSHIEQMKLARIGGYLGEQARCSLITEFYPWILVRCTQILKHHDDALDAAQEVTLRMHKSLAAFEGRSSIHTWLNIIIRNECISLIRKQQRTAISGQLAALISLYEQEQRFEDAPDSEVIESVGNALHVLCPEHQEVLQLRFFKDLPITEIGALLGLSVSAAKMRLYRAIAAFKQVFTAQLERELLAA